MTNITQKISSIFNSFLANSAPSVSMSGEEEGINIFLSGRKSKRQVRLMNATHSVIGDTYRLTGSLSISKIDQHSNVISVSMSPDHQLVKREQGTWWSCCLVEMDKNAAPQANELRKRKVMALTLAEAREHATGDAEKVFAAIAAKPSQTRGYEADIFGTVAPPRYKLENLLVVFAPSGAPGSDAQWTNTTVNRSTQVNKGLDAPEE